MATSRPQASATGSSNGNRKAIEITPFYCCTLYFCTAICFVVLCFVVIFFASFDKRCYLELYANSVSVTNSTTNANVSTADWSFGFVAKSPFTGCKISLYSIKSRLLRGQEVISESSSSPSVGYFGFAASYKPDWTVANIGFDKVVTPEVMGDVVWNVRVELVARMNTDVRYGNDDLIMDSFLDYADERLVVICRDIPVKFTVDAAGNKMGSLLGNMRRCDYKIVFNFDNSDSGY